MCLIVLAYKVHKDFPLVVAANRDEFYERPTAAASVWPEESGILAGRDLRGQGTWLGVTASGRFAAVTNYRSAEKPLATSTSRGDLVTGFLRGEQKVEEYLSTLIGGSSLYQGYNLLAYDGENLAYASNRGKERLQILKPGIYGLSNAHLNTPWPKVTQCSAALERQVQRGALNAEDLIGLMQDTQRADEASLPDTGVPKEWELLLSSAFIESEEYGTRCTTVVKFAEDGEVEFVERSHGVDDEESVTQRFQFSVASD